VLVDTATLSLAPPPASPDVTVTTVANTVTAVQNNAGTVQWVLFAVLAVALLVVIRRVRRLRRTHRDLLPRPTEAAAPPSERSSSPDR
jgi:membrane protein implicated in regulation of membrane protease activity